MKTYYLRYGFWGTIYMIKCKLITKLFFKNARLIRLPIDIRGKKFIDFGNSLTTGKYCRFEALVKGIEKQDKHSLVFGSNVTINDSVHIGAMNSVIIGNDVLIASKVFISDHSHGDYKEIGTDPSIPPAQRKEVAAAVVIEDNVWIGEFVSILPGVTIGQGSIIGTMSVVNKSIPPFCIAVGAPARVIKKYNFDNKQWERYHE
ncbi:acetyltransferase [Mucilaginibacter ximonensis]|uniref:Acetyltransferase n=1 Tax=Mucilaginibacter ximonensis TaxID=538021 RepID=A0ABW5YES6_9SPHI